jgi:D-ornithine 4,5-aminomutase subunit beta
VAQYGGDPADPAALIGGCTFEDRSKIVFVDELDEMDNVNVRMKEVEKYRKTSLVKPEMEWMADGIIMLNMFIPEERRTAEVVAVEIGKKLGLLEPEVINREVMQDAEGTRIELKGRVPFDIDVAGLVIPPEPHYLTDQEIRDDVSAHPLKVVCATVGQDEHSVGLREIIDIKHGGIERFGIEIHYLGTSCPVEKLVDAAVELKAEAILASTIISHDNIHYKNMKRIHELAVEKGIRDDVIILCGGTQVIPEEALKTGIDAGFGRNSHGIDVATALVEKRREKRAKQ